MRLLPRLAALNADILLLLLLRLPQNVAANAHALQIVMVLLHLFHSPLMSELSSLEPRSSHFSFLGSPLTLKFQLLNLKFLLRLVTPCDSLSTLHYLVQGEFRP